MCEFVENVRRLLEPAFGIGVSKIHDIVVNRQHLFNCPQVDDIMSHYVHKVQTPYSDHVVHEDEVLLRGVLLG